MSGGFRPEWLAARDRYDVAALDREIVGAVRSWAADQPLDRPLVVVDLGSGTGAAIRRALTWLGRRPLTIYAVDGDARLLGLIPSAEARIIPVVADLLGPLGAAGGPDDGTVDLLLAHAVADLLPLDRFAGRVAALLRPSGIAHVALTYDGETEFEPTDEPGLDRTVIDAYHRHMDLGRRSDPMHGGSTAGRRLVDALRGAGLAIERNAPAVWDVQAADGPGGRAVLAGLIGFVERSLVELGEPTPADVCRWAVARRAALAAGTLACRVRHLDALATRIATTRPT